LSEPFPDFTFAPIGVISESQAAGPKRPTLSKAAARNFRIAGFESLVSPAVLPDPAIAPSDPHIMASTDFSHILSENAFSGNRYLVQPLPSGLLNDPSPSLSPDDHGEMASSSTLQQFIITRTPPAEHEWANANSEVVLEAEGGQQVSESVGVATGESSTTVARVESELASGTQWMVEVIPQIGKSTIKPYLVRRSIMTVRSFSNRSASCTSAKLANSNPHSCTAHAVHPRALLPLYHRRGPRSSISTTYHVDIALACRFREIQHSRTSNNSTIYSGGSRIGRRLLHDSCIRFRSGSPGLPNGYLFPSYASEKQLCHTAPSNHSTTSGCTAI
jgi:hypothetical protein